MFAPSNTADELSAHIKKSGYSRKDRPRTAALILGSLFISTVAIRIYQIIITI